MIVIGLGSGRTGTASLSKLFNSQRDAVCFHELNPTGCVFEGNPQPVLNTIAEFGRIIAGGPKNRLAIDYSRRASLETYETLQQRETVSLMGDIAYYYLKYVDDILEINNSVRFVCIKRDRNETVDSWIEKSSIQRWSSLRLADRIKSFIVRVPYHESKNFWQDHDGTEYQSDPIWDKTFPKFEANSKREAIEKYWDYYYDEAARLAQRHPENFRIFDISDMSTPDGQRRILGFIGIAPEKMVVKDSFHEHKSGRKASAA